MGIDHSQLFFHPSHPPKNAFGLMVLELKTPFVQLPDQEIKGIVHIQLQQQMPAYQLQIQLIGTEKVMWSERRGSGKHRYTVWFRGEGSIVNSVQTVFVFQNNIIPAGSNSIEFTMKLPQRKYPSSCTILNRWVNYAVINYNVVAMITGPNPLSFVRTLEVKEDIGPQIPGLLITDKQKYDCCCYCNQGNLELAASADKISYLTSEKCRLTVRVNTNDLKISVPKINLTLVARIHATSTGGYSREFETQIYKWSQEGVEKGKEETKTYELDLLYALRNPESILPTSMTPEGRQLAMGVQASSSHGSCVRLDYYIDVMGAFD